MLNYHHLRYFWIVAHEGNLTRAAKKQNIAQSALSMQIHALEEYFGQPLFARQGRQMVLTEAGHVALEFADAIFAKGEELQGTMGMRSEPRQQVLRVGALATLSRNLQMTFLRPVIKELGHGIVIRSGRMEELLHDLEHYALDVVLSNVMPSHRLANLMVHTIAQQQVSLVGHPHRARMHCALDELLRTESIALPAHPSSIRTEFDAFVDRMQIQPQIVAEVDDMAMLRLVAREHRGLTVVPLIVVKDELDSGVLVEVATLPGLMETFYALTLPRRFPHPLLQMILQRHAVS
jgi:LysR family transcriptional regulator, transcriptional activator of nhaA